MGSKFKKVLKIGSAILILVVAAAGDFSMSCPNECKCLWTGGSKAANCTHANFHDIPTALSAEVQNLDLTGNDIYEISEHAFENVGLSNLKKLVLKECKLITIHKSGLSGLGIMIELDLSNNDLRKLHPDTFKETEKIRWIFLNDNKLEKLEDELFKNLPFLQKVELANNLIVQLGVKTFIDVPKLNALRLDGNKLEHLKVETLSTISALSSLELHNNPWRCDCYLQPFRNWVIRKNLYTPPTSCAEPPTVHGKLWKELDSDNFACKPTIVYPTTGAVLRSSDANITLSCKVSGNPAPEVSWVLGTKIIDGSYRYGEMKYYLSQSMDEHTKWMNLTILEAGGSDNGDYLCVAKNSGGIDEKNITLFVTHSGPGVIAPASIDGNMLPVLIGISCSAAILLIIIVIICYCCCCRIRRSVKKKSGETSNGEALIEGSLITDMDKSIITSVNPVTKPPRRYDMPPSITSGVTEMSELNKTLLDTDSVYATNEDEKHSLDFDHTLSKRSHEILNYSNHDGHAYPPDLLSFPSRAPQLSPAASNASTVPDTTRLPLQLNPTSPIHSPIYSYNQNLYRTLPHSRSQSPFTAPITPPVITPRQGYVTIPRRPRIPSWSSTASTQLLSSSEAQEPLYDNLGLRTTADGSSVLSLNKAGLDQPISPMRGRPLPATPTLYPNHHPIYCAPIDEHEPALSPVPVQYATAKKPRSSVSSQLSSQFSSPGPQEPAMRSSWNPRNSSTPPPDSKKQFSFIFPGNESRSSVDGHSQISDSSTLSRKGNKPETGSLRRNPRAELKEVSPTKTSPVKDEALKNDFSLPVNLSGTMGKSGKIPPRPPPKPKKKPNPELNDQQILFEDEGEDGTEV